MFAWITELDTERVPLSSRLRNLWPILVPLGITFLLTLVQWLWWKYNVWNLNTLPTSKCKYHVIMTTTILASVFKNKVADANVLFFQILR
ncbi:unnamed protein product, partial [Larinioides sclopetarius]